MKLFTIALYNLVVESTINGFAKGRSRSWKDVLFDGRTSTEKLVDDSLKDMTNGKQFERVERLSEEILATIKAEVAAEVKAQLAGREVGDGRP